MIFEKFLPTSLEWFEILEEIPFAKDILLEICLT